MITVALEVFALAVACVVVWFAARRTKTVQRVSSHLSGPVEQMQEQILLTADMAVDRLDGKIAQMEILLSEIDRRSTLMVQQNKQQQLLQLQLEQQQQQLVVWVQTQKQQFDQELIKIQARQIASAQPLSTECVDSVGAENVMTHFDERVNDQSEVDAKPIASHNAKGSKIPHAVKFEVQPPQKDKRTTILDMAEQGCSVTDIAQKMGVGKGEVMLLLKLRKRVTT